MRVYCEHSALHAKIRVLQRAGRITLVGFPYDPNSRSRPIRQLALPSSAQIDDLNLPIGDMKFRIGEMVGSDKHVEIECIFGRSNRRDVLHIDSAYRSGCVCFFTRDRGDILAKRTELESLLGVRFFHPDDDWDRFIDFLNATECGV
jgi:hypothetical protein